MYALRFRLRSFESMGARQRETVLRLLLEALVAENIAYLRAHPTTPRLLDSGVVYELDDPRREEHWKDIAETLSRGAGDCKDLVAWRLAELRIDGEHATAHVEFYASGGRLLNHVTVRRADGRIEDPSRALGFGFR